MKGARAVIHRWGPLATAVAIPCCLVMLVVIARLAITRATPQLTTVTVAIEQLPRAINPGPLLDIIVHGWPEHIRHHPRLRLVARQALIAAAQRALHDDDPPALTAVADALTVCQLWTEIPEQLRLAINERRLHPSPHALGALILLCALLLPLAALIMVWRRWIAGPPPIDPKAETLDNVEPIDVDTSDITIVSTDTRTGTHTTTVDDPSKLLAVSGGEPLPAGETQGHP